jgi:hypothetical protein
MMAIVTGCEIHDGELLAIFGVGLSMLAGDFATASPKNKVMRTSCNCKEQQAARKRC